MSATKPKLFGVSLWAVPGVFLFVGLLCMTMADGAVYLRTMMPFESSEAALPDAVSADEDEFEDIDQRLIELLYQDDQDVVYDVVKNDQRWRVVQMRVTAYCPCSVCCGKWADGITANNHRIRPGDTFAAADKMYRFGTEMVVPGYNNNQPIEVKDRGRVIKGNRLDVFFSSHSVAKQWGTRTLDVLVRER